MLANRLREDAEGRELVPQNQTGFRRGMSTMDNIFALNFLINRQLVGWEGDGGVFCGSEGRV